MPNPVGPEPGDGTPVTGLCVEGDTCWNADLWEPFEDSECIPDADWVLDARVGCVYTGGIDSDNEWDSLIEPVFGFGTTLAYRITEAFGGVLCTGSVFPCPSCTDVTADPYNPTPPSDKLTDPDALPAPVTSAHLDECGDASKDLSCAQFDDSGAPIETGTAFDNLSPFDVDSCLFRYLNEKPEEGECETDYPTLIAATFTPYVPYPSSIRSGFFRDRLAGAESDDDQVVWNHPREPFGARIIGREPDWKPWYFEIWPGEGVFGFSVTQSGNFLVISAPRRDVSYGKQPQTLHELNLTIRGTAYITDLKDLWTLGLVDGSESPDVAAIPPKPHMYRAGGGGHSGRPVNRVGELCVSSDIWRKDLTFSKGFETVGGGLTINGRRGDHIRHVRGISDFNNDGRSDIAIGAPEADPYASPDSTTISQDGAVYVVYRRAPSLEGNYALDKLSLAPNDPNRLAGVFIKGPQGTGDQFGEVIVGGVDFGTGLGTNGAATSADNQVPELVVASPYADGDRGEVWIVFPGTQQDPLITPEGGALIEELLADRKVARITGSQAGDLFGFNMANVGDIDGDGLNDLLIAAPGATPRFDSTPFDASDVLDANGIDREPPFGVADNIDGPMGIPDKDANGEDIINQSDQLERAGLVYVILSGVEATRWADDDTKPMEISIDKIGSAELPGFIIAGRRVGDQLGGGRASQDNCHKLALHDPDPYDIGGDLPCDCSAETIPDVCVPRSPWDVGRSFGVAGAGDVDDDGRGDFLLGSILADPRVDPDTGSATVNAGEAYLIYGFEMDK